MTMSKPSHKRADDRTRQRLAQECARIIADEGIKDFKLAKSKARERLGVSPRVALPSNVEIEEALFEQQRLFNPDEQQQLRHLRQIALEAMRFLSHFQPCLVGSVLKGIVTSRLEVQPHVFADTSEELILYLIDHDMPFEISERRLRTGSQGYQQFPVIQFVVDDATVDLTIFSRDSGREPPRSPVDGQPMRRARLSEVEDLIA